MGDFSSLVVARDRVAVVACEDPDTSFSPRKRKCSREKSQWREKAARSANRERVRERYRTTCISIYLRRSVPLLSRGREGAVPRTLAAVAC